MVLRGRPPPLGVPPGSLRPSGGARHRKAGSSSPWWSPSWPSRTTRTPPPPGGGPHPPEGPGPCPSPGPRAGPPLPLALAPPAAPVPAAPAPRPPPPPPRRGHPRRLRPSHGGGWLVLGSLALGGDEFSGVGVDVVEVGVVVVVVVGVVRQHLLDAGGDAPQRLHVWLRGRPTPLPPPFVPPSPPGSHAPSCLSPGAHGALALALALGSLASPHASVPLSVPWVSPPVTHALACTASARALRVPVPMPLAAPALAHRPSLRSVRPVAACLGALLASLRALPVPWPLPGSLPCVASSTARALSSSAAAGLGAPSLSAPLLLAACALARPLRVPLGTSPVASCPPLRATLAGTLPCLRAVSHLLDHAPGVPLLLQLQQRNTPRRTLGRRGADVARPPRAEGPWWGTAWGGWCGCG